VVVVGVFVVVVGVFVVVCVAVVVVSGGVVGVICVADVFDVIAVVVGGCYVDRGCDVVVVWWWL